MTGKHIRVPPALYDKLMKIKSDDESIQDVIQKLVHFYNIAKVFTSDDETP